MRKGDKKTKRGKVVMGTFGVKRPKRKAAPQKEKSKKSGPNEN